MRFHKLRVTDIERDTANSVIVTLALPTEHSHEFEFISGQYLTFRHKIDGEEIRRNYSISLGQGAATLQVGIKRVVGGVFSTFANQELQVGDTLEVMPPQGRFVLKDLVQSARVLLIAAGSGITPMLSHIETLLTQDSAAQITLIYGNRTPHSVMFRERLEALKSSYLTRFNLVHVFSGAGQEAELFSGRISGERVERIMRTWLRQDDFDAVLLCGPEAMIVDVKASLVAMGLLEARIGYELFTTGQAPRRKQATAAPSSAATKLTIILDGTAHPLAIRPGECVLEAAQEHNIEAPYSCRSGICSTCRCKIIDGSGEMEINHALEDYEVQAGYALACQLRPTSAKLVVDFDSGH